MPAQVNNPAPTDVDRPAPPVPMEAVMLNDFTPLELTITAARDGAIKKVVISKPARPRLYHPRIRDWVEAHWKMPPAGPQEPELRKFVAPILFDKASMPRGKFPDPIYPSELLHDRISGKVDVEIEVAATGAIRSVRAVRKSQYQILNEYVPAFIKAYWKFPAGYEGLYSKTFEFIIY